MINFIILARSGSKGLPGKNIKLFCRKPLIVWSILAAQQSKYCDKLIVSTDSPEIGAISLSHGAKFHARPDILSTDSSSSASVVECLIKEFKLSGAIVLLQPTSPLRNEAHINEFIEFSKSHNSDSAISVCKSNKPINWHFHKNTDDILERVNIGKPAQRRQDSNDYFYGNGAMYFFTVSSFLRTKKILSDRPIGFEMSKVDSCDIDDLVDFKIAEFLANEFYPKRFLHNV